MIDSVRHFLVDMLYLPLFAAAAVLLLWWVSATARTRRLRGQARVRRQVDRIEQQMRDDPSFLRAVLDEQEQWEERQ